MQSPRDRKAIAEQVPQRVDAIVVGGGHAGIEAAAALAKLGHRVALVTFDVTALARMSCNPSIGGLAKGQLAREVDALGGLMGRLIDRAGIHYRMLNRRKGPAVHAPRAQADKAAYSREAARMLAQLPNLLVVEGEVVMIHVKHRSVRQPSPADAEIVGVTLAPPEWNVVEPGGAHSSGPARGLEKMEDLPHDEYPRTSRVEQRTEIEAPVVVLTVGTFLRGKVFTGMDPRPGGRRGEPPARGLADALKALGLQLGRLKTGTPPRLLKSSIDFARVEEQPGDDPPPRFSFFDDSEVCNRVVCHLTRTNEKTHQVIAAALDRSPLYGGLIEGIGPRYCPSIEDKIMRFPDRDSHHIFLEPEGVASEEVYPNGISTSLPRDVQEAYVRTIPGLEEAQIVHPGYAVEYDFLLTSQIDATLGVRGIRGLFSAGQLNGTSGYEEAAAQGIVAGLNANALLSGKAPVVLARSQAYIGVLIDDLVTKVPTEPYRMFTSQSEYRLLLRQDNADRRLAHLGRQIGLVSPEDWRRTEERWNHIERERERLRSTRLTRGALRTRDGAKTALDAGDVGKSFEELLKRPGVTLEELIGLGHETDLRAAEWVTLEAEIKYAGYIRKQETDIARTRALERMLIPKALVEDPPTGLSREAAEKLHLHRPRTLGQALRIPGISPSDVFVLAIRIRARSAGSPG